MNERRATQIEIYVKWHQLGIVVLACLALGWNVVNDHVNQSELSRVHHMVTVELHQMRQELAECERAHIGETNE